MCGGKRTAHLSLLAASALGLAIPRAGAGQSAEYFGRNKVQYEDFDFQVLGTEHFDLHFYPAEEAAARDAALKAERWYFRLARLLDHRIESRQPLILYADHSDFQQTNVVDGLIGESTGGVTESLERRVIMPLFAVRGETDHVLGHELVHAFQYDLAADSGGIGRLSALPLWTVEGMAEYLSLGRSDPHTAMWLRDAVLHEDIPTLADLSRGSRYFPYRFGEAVWAYIGGRWGDEKVAQLFRAALGRGWEEGVRNVLDITVDSLSAQWAEAVRSTYQPLLVGRSAPDELGRPIGPAISSPGETVLAPAASPDGRRVAYLWARDFSLDLYLADTRSGDVRHLASGSTGSHYDAVSYMGSSGTWSPDGRKLAFVVFARGDQELAILDVASGSVERRMAVPNVSAIASPAWSPDGRHIAFSGSAGGESDLYLLDVTSGETRRLTQDAAAQLQPAWSPDGRTLAFATDVAEVPLAVVRVHESGLGDAPAAALGDGARPRASLTLALLDVASGATQRLRLFALGRHTDPQFAPDGENLYFLSDVDGFKDLYRTELRSGKVFRVTRLATGISGLTSLSPALSVASRTGELFFSVFDRRGFRLAALDPAATATEPVDVRAPPRGEGAAGRLPPVDSPGAVESYLGDAASGLPDPAEFTTRAYAPRPRLSYFGAPTLGIGIDRFGASVYLDAEAYFTDVLGDHGLSTRVLANGGWKELGGQVFYQSRGGRLNWGVGLAHIPQVLTYGVQSSGGFTTVLLRQRVSYDQALASLRYPLSQTRRLELSASALAIDYDYELLRATDPRGGSGTRQTTALPTPQGLELWQTGLALVEDRSVFGIASPIRGTRYRFEVEPAFGSFNFVTALADWRGYAYRRPFTLAVRGLHYGRYGGGADRAELGSLYLGAQGLVRGYDYNSFASGECTGVSAGPTGCAVVDRLFGSRLAVGNVELRVPLIGDDRFGLLDFPFLPTELALFLDGGNAWSGGEGLGSPARSPVFSSGASARFNLFGALVAEAYYALPFQRTSGARWGFQLVPGW
jgi:hypothetical protein